MRTLPPMIAFYEIAESALDNLTRHPHTVRRCLKRRPRLDPARSIWGPKIHPRMWHGGFTMALTPLLLLICWTGFRNRSWGIHLRDVHITCAVEYRTKQLAFLKPGASSLYSAATLLRTLIIRNSTNSSDRRPREMASSLRDAFATPQMRLEALIG